MKTTEARELGFALRVMGWTLKGIAADPRIARSVDTIRNWSIQGFWTARANRERAKQGLVPLSRKVQRDGKTGRILSGWGA